MEIGLLELMGIDRSEPVRDLAPKPKTEAQKEKKDENPEEPDEENLANEAQIDKWEELLEETKKDKISVYAFLCEGNPTKEGDKLKIEFDPAYSFHKESLEKKENRDFLKSKIEQIYGPCELEIKWAKDADRSESNQTQSEDRLKRKAHMVKETFDGKIVT